MSHDVTRMPAVGETWVTSDGSKAKVLASGVRVLGYAEGGALVCAFVSENGYIDSRHSVFFCSPYGGGLGDGPNLISYHREPREYWALVHNNGRSYALLDTPYADPPEGIVQIKVREVIP